MKGLKRLLIRKIVITAVFLCAPLLLFPQSFFIDFGITNESMLFLRLLGFAYLALLVGYYGGMRTIDDGENPVSVIYMGLVSNGFAGFTFLIFGLMERWAHLSLWLQIYLWVITIGAFYMTFQLLRVAMRHGLLKPRKERHELTTD